GGGVFQIDVGYPIEKPIGKENEPFEASSQGSGNAVSAHARGELVGSFADSSNRSFPINGLRVWSSTFEGKTISINLTLPGPTLMEGELCLVFRMDALALFTMTFSIVPGNLVGIPSHQTIFIGGFQGTKGHTGTIRYASKAMGEICPSKMLMISIRALGRALGIGIIIGVSSAEHVCETINRFPNEYLSQYDFFWMANGGEPLGKSFKMRVGLSDKPSTSSSASHRARARRKKLLMHTILEEMVQGFQLYFKRPNGKLPDRNNLFLEPVMHPETELSPGAWT
ncbi:MAG TPA: DUF535 family protein, partial [Fibrobacteria bacterium]|nr:DUF535 family protein [Fibrobacteria bacterium]